MKSGVRSSVHLMTANAPSTVVQCHRPSTRSDVRKPVDGNTMSTTNEYLKRGGSLPPVQASGFCMESVCNKTKNYGCQQQTVQMKYPKRKKVQSYEKAQNPDPASKTDSNRYCKDHIDVNDLERKMEQLSCKLSKVQDIISDHMNNEDSKQQSYNDDQCKGFSAQDYAILMLEMNGNLAAHPYDPNEFSDNNGRIVDDVDQKLSKKWEGTKIGCDKKEILQAIQKELSTWRSEEDCTTLSMSC